MEYWVLGLFTEKPGDAGMQANILQTYIYIVVILALGTDKVANSPSVMKHVIYFSGLVQQMLIRYLVQTSRL